MSDERAKAYPQGTMVATQLNMVAEPILMYLEQYPPEFRAMILANLAVAGYLLVGKTTDWIMANIKDMCDVQVAQIKLNKAGAN